MSDRQAGRWLGWDERWYPGTPPPGWWEAPDGRWHPPEGSDVGDGAGGVPEAPYRQAARTGAPGRTFRHPAYVDLPGAGTRTAVGTGVTNDGGRAQAHLPDPWGSGGRGDDEAFQAPAYLDAPNTNRPGELHDRADRADRDRAAPGRFDSFFDPAGEDVPERGRAAGAGSDPDGGTRPYDGWTYGAGGAGHTGRDEDGDRDGSGLDPTLTSDDPDVTAAYDAKHFAGVPNHHPNETGAYGARHLADADGSDADANPFAATTVGHDDDPSATTTVGHDDDPFVTTSTRHDDAVRFAARSDPVEHQRFGADAGPVEHQWVDADAGPDDHDPFAATMVVHDDAGRSWSGGGDSSNRRPPAPWQVSVAATRRSRMAAEDDAAAGDGGDFLDGYRTWPVWARVAMPIVVLVLFLAIVVAGFLLPGDDQTATTDGTTTLPTSGGVTVTGATSTSTTTETDATGTTEAPADETTATTVTATTVEATTTTRPRGPSTTGTTATTATTVPESGCHSSYSGCVPADASDVDCTGRGDGPVWVDGPIEVTGPDVYDLDRNHDGTACQ